MLQLKQLFAFAGEVTSLTIVGDLRQFALVEYSNAQARPLRSWLSIVSNRLGKLQCTYSCGECALTPSHAGGGWLQEAGSALGMNNMQVADRTIKVEPAKLACEATPQSTSDPFAALHAHRVAQLQLVQMQQEQLTAQVAQMRALAKTNPGLIPTSGIVAQNSASQKNAALAAAAALSKRLALLTGGGPKSAKP